MDVLSGGVPIRRQHGGEKPSRHRPGAVPPQLAAVRTNGATGVNLGGYSSTTATVSANRTLTVKTPATLPPGVTQVRVTLTRVADPASPTRQPLSSAVLSTVAVNGGATTSLALGAGQKRQINIGVRMNATWPQNVQYRFRLLVQVRDNAATGPSYAHAVPFKVCFGAGPGPD